MIPILTDVERDIVDELERYDSLLMFHEVRTCFMGAIACPTDGINPMRMITSIWGGELPTFLDVKDADQFFDIFINQLWDPFAEQQMAKKPFELTKWRYKATKKDLAALAEIRTDEIAVFIDAIEGPDDENVKLPRRAVQAVRVLGEVYGLLSAIELLAIDKSIPKPKSEIAELLIQMEKMTAIAELEINEAIIACNKKRTNLSRKKQKNTGLLH